MCRCTFNRYSVITEFAKLAAGEQLCCPCTHRKLHHFKTFKIFSWKIINFELSHSCRKWATNRYLLLYKFLCLLWLVRCLNSLFLPFHLSPLGYYCDSIRFSLHPLTYIVLRSFVRISFSLCLSWRRSAIYSSPENQYVQCISYPWWLLYIFRSLDLILGAWGSVVVKALRY